MPKAKSKAQQRKFWAMANRGQMSTSEAKKRSVSGKAFKRLPSRKGKKG